MFDEILEILTLLLGLIMIIMLWEAVKATYY